MMKPNGCMISCILLLAIPAICTHAQTFTTLYNFTGGADGGEPLAGVIHGLDGELYGTTIGGGDLNCDLPYGCGVVYKLNTGGTETVLHRFSGSDGASPSTPMARDNAGNFYGTTGEGGSGDCGGGCGTVFEIDSEGNETRLYSFSGGSDGCNPDQGLIVSKSGVVYGTTAGYGCSSYGTIFKVDRAGNLTTLHTFLGPDGASPMYGHLLIGKSGNLYGTTEVGGGFGYGVLYRLSTDGTLTVLHSFSYGTSDGCRPYGSVARDKAGNFYGTTIQCGSNNFGTIWKVSETGEETILHSFAGGSSDGCYPSAGVTRDSEGNLYGVTGACGADAAGTLYELSTSGNITLLHSFAYSDGYGPNGEVLRTQKGELFGTTQGSSDEDGTVWSYVPGATVLGGAISP